MWQQVSNMLRQMLLCDDSENAELYSHEEKSEFLWRVFEHICLGGACCQFEVRYSPRGVKIGCGTWCHVEFPYDEGRRMDGLSRRTLMFLT